MEEKIYNPKIYDDEDLRRKCGVYQIRNLVSGKLYVGSSNNLLFRKRYGHFGPLENNTHENEYLQKSFNIYGKDNFVFEVIEFCKEEEQYENEQYWLDKFYDHKKNCYNINPIANKPPSNYGRAHTEETKNKISKIHKNKIVSQETRKKISDNMKKRFKNPQNNPMYGRHHTEESKKKMSETKKAKGCAKGSRNSGYGKIGKLSPVAVKVINIEDGRVFDCIKDCLNAYHLSRACIHKHCTHKVKSPKFMYYSDYLKLNIDK